MSSQATFVYRLTESIRDKYRLGAQLGQAGQYGVAREATSLATGECVAVKIISKARFQRIADRSRHFEMMRQEIEIMKTLDHPNIIKLYDVFEDALDLYLVMELCNGGELFDQIEARGSFSEQDASKVMRQIVQALAYLHRHKIVHLDLKPDNFLFKDKLVDSPIKMIDFGMASTIHPRQHLSKLCGTPYYIAPEVIDRHYNEACDMWSVGVVTFVMLFGFPPFWVDPAQYGKHADEAIFKLIQKGFTPKTKPGFGAFFPASIKVSESAKDLIAKLLSLDVADRLTAEEALEHPWLKGETASPHPIEDHVRSNFVKFHGKNKFREAILGTMTDILPKEKIQELKELFETVDLNHDGTLTVAEISECLKKYPVTQIRDLVSTMDLDGDGTINYNELLKAAIFRKVGAKEERLWRAFQKIDINHDGTITVNELRQALGKDSGQDTEQLIKEADTNHDGVVDYSEFLQLFDQELVDALQN